MKKFSKLLLFGVLGAVIVNECVLVVGYIAYVFAGVRRKK